MATIGDPDIRGRMLLYHALIYEIYKIEVVGFVVYLGNQRANMETHLLHGALSYSFELVDPRKLNPYVFLESELPEEIILAVLAGTNKNDRRQIIREIISKLHKLLQGNEQEFKRRILQLEVLSLLRDEQKIVNEEEQNMALTIDFTKDIRYQQGIEVGEEKGIEKGMEIGEKKGFKKGEEIGSAKNNIEVSRKMIEQGYSLEQIQLLTGLSLQKLKDLAKAIIRE